MDHLESTVKDYAWGSTTALQELLGRPVDGAPAAELWLGAHPASPSLAGDRRVPLDTLVLERPSDVLGADVHERFGPRLPFLLKVIAAASPLSLQVHPTDAQARAGFDAEEAAGVPLDDRRRRYKDPHHKPEMLVALTSFEALCGFREPAAAADLLAGVQAPGVTELVDRLTLADPSTALEAAFRHVLRAGPELVDGVAGALARRLRDGSPHAAEDETVVGLAAAYPGDPGVVLSLLLHRVTLVPGEALFLDSGNVHAYLSGTAVEVMASSDNVLRGGLTPKHVDAAELLRVVDFRPVPVPYVHPDVDGPVTTWRPGAAEFELHRVSPSGHAVLVPGRGPRVVLGVDGSLDLSGREVTLALPRGAAAVVVDSDGPVDLLGRGEAFVAAVPQV